MEFGKNVKNEKSSVTVMRVQIHWLVKEKEHLLISARGGFSAPPRAIEFENVSNK